MASTDESPETPPEPARPLLRVVKGEPTAEELAALVTVLAARSAAAEPEPVPAPSAWSHRRAQLSRPVFVGAGEWRRSGFEKGTRTRADW